MFRKNKYKPNSRLEIGCFGLLLALTVCPILIMSYAAIVAFKDFQAFPAQPAHITLAKAPSLLAGKEKIWVIIDDIQWDCNHIFHKETRRRKGYTTYYTTYILFTNKDKNVWGVTSFSGELTCDQMIEQEKEAVGVLQLIDNDESVESMSPISLIDNGFDIWKYRIGNKFLWFCHTCGGRNDAMRDLLLSFAVILFLLLVIALILFWRI
jgi:hypothetical protein